MAEAVKHHAALQSVEIVTGARMDNETGLAMAEAVKHHAALQSVKLDVRTSKMDNETGLAMAEAIEHNVQLQSFNFFDHKEDSTEHRRMAALREAYVARNQELRKQRHAIAALSRGSASTGFHSLSERLFRRAVFTYYLPPLCKQMPLDFAHHATNSAAHTPNCDRDVMNVSWEANYVPFECVSADHDEPAAEIDAEEAATTSQELWATAIEHCLVGWALPPRSSTAGLGGRHILLAFDRLTRDLENALLASPTACSAVARGIEVQPSWAGGAKIFAEGVCPERIDVPLHDGILKPWHVVVREQDEDELLAALGDLPVRLKKLKPRAGRAVFPSDLSFLDVSSEGEHEVADDATEVIPYYVRRTFLNVELPTGDARSSCTW